MRAAGQAHALRCYNTICLSSIPLYAAADWVMERLIWEGRGEEGAVLLITKNYGNTQ